MAGTNRTGRGAQLYAAAVVLRQRVEPGLIAGDLNATSWDIAVERMMRLAGMIAPRRDRGYAATWNAHSILCRWPRNHVFHEGGFATVSIESLDALGMDHFPDLMRLCRLSGVAPAEAPQRQAGDVAAAHAVLFGRRRDRTGAGPMSHPIGGYRVRSCALGRGTRACQLRSS